MGRGLLFQVLVPSDDTANSESAMGIKPGDSGVVIGYKVDEFTHTWSAEQFVACSHIYPGFIGKVSSLTHFPLEPQCEDYAFIDQAVVDFEQGLDSILTDSLETPELDTSLEEPDAVTFSSVSSGFLCSVSALSDNSKPQLAPSIHTCKLWCQARALLALCLWLPRFQHLNWSVTFLATLQPLDSGSLLHLITSPWILPIGRLISLRFSDWCWCCCTCYFWHRATYFSSPGCPAWYSFLTTQGWGRCYTCVWSAWITSPNSWHFGQGCFQVSWKFSMYFSTSV